MIRNFKNKVSELGWNVEEECGELTFSRISLFGQDFEFSIEGSFDDLDVDIESHINKLIDLIHEYYENFDVSYEAYLLLDQTGHGKNGAPYRMIDVYKDMEWCEEQIDLLCDELYKIQQS